MDLAVDRACARHTSPRIEQCAQIASWLADEKAVLAGAAMLWLVTRRWYAPAERGEANRLLTSVLVAGALPHLLKFVVRRRRPDRSLVRGSRRHGIPRSGNAWDSFPSGHALHMGAAAASVARLVPYWLRPLVWSGFAALAGTRVLLLAHYPSDVAAGWGVGVLINKGMGALLRRASAGRLRLT